MAYSINIELAKTLQLDWFALVRAAVFHAAVGWVVYLFALSVYRVSLHPLASFPGPRIAGATYLYELWFDVICGGRYTQEIIRLHERYGPIVRINPDELHCNDPEFIPVLYTSGNKRRHKWSHNISGFGGDLASSFGTLDHSHHRVRRAALNKFFSPSNVDKCESTVHSKTQKLCDKLLEHRGRAPFNAVDAFNGFVTDAITEFCFGSCPNFLERDDFQSNAPYVSMLEKLTHPLRHIPWMLRIIDMLPLKPVKLLSSSCYSLLVSTRPVLQKQMANTISAWEINDGKGIPMYDAIRDADMPIEEKLNERLFTEMFAAAFAGPISVAIVLSRITYHLVDDPRMGEKLREELQAVISDPRKLPTVAVLNELPYLTAVINEGLRMICDPSRKILPYETSQERVARIAPDEDLEYTTQGSPNKRNHRLPRGYAISMTWSITHSNESIFPDASKFIPERWINADGQRDKSLEKHLLAFSRGNRLCVATKLCYSVLYISVAALTLRVLSSLEIFNPDHLHIGDDDEIAGKEAENDGAGFQMRVVG